MVVKWIKEYRKHDDEGVTVVLEPTEDPVMVIVPYQALVKKIELYVDGRIHQGDASALAKGGWSFHLEDEETVMAIASAVVLSRALGEAPPSDIERRLAQDEEVFRVVEPIDLVKSRVSGAGRNAGTLEDSEAPGIEANASKPVKTSTLTYSQKKFLQRREDGDGNEYKPLVLDERVFLRVFLKISFEVIRNVFCSYVEGILQVL